MLEECIARFRLALGNSSTFIRETFKHLRILGLTTLPSGFTHSHPKLLADVHTWKAVRMCGILCEEKQW